MWYCYLKDFITVDYMFIERKTEHIGLCVCGGSTGPRTGGSMPCVQPVTGLAGARWGTAREPCPLPEELVHLRRAH